jgi:hypothetical protein
VVLDRLLQASPVWQYVGREPVPVVQFTYPGSSAGDRNPGRGAGCPSRSTVAAVNVPAGLLLGLGVAGDVTWQREASARDRAAEVDDPFQLSPAVGSQSS